MLFSLLVAAFWGGNIGALYPVIQVAFKGRSLQAWLDEEIQQSQRAVAQHRTRVRQLQTELTAAAADDARSLQRQLSESQFNLQAEERVLQTRERIRPWLDRWLPSDPFRTVEWIVFFLVVTTAIKGFFLFANAMCVDRLVQRVTYDLRRQFYHQALRMDLGAFGEERTSGLLSRFNSDIGCVSAGLRNLFGSAVREPLKMLACLVGASLISWRLLVFSLLLTPLIGLLIRLLAGSIKRANRRVLEEISQLYGVLTETFNGIQTVQAYTLEQRERQRFHQVSKQCLRKSMRIALYNALTKPATEVMGIAMISLALTAGAYLTLNQQTHLLGIRLCNRPLDLATLLVFYGLLIGTIEPAQVVGDFQFASGRTGGGRSLVSAPGSPADDRQSGEPAVAAPAAPADHAGPRQLPLCARRAGAAGHQPHGGVRRNDCDCGPQRVRQDHAGATAAAILRPRRGIDSLG